MAGIAASSALAPPPAALPSVVNLARRACSSAPLFFIVRKQPVAARGRVPRLVVAARSGGGRRYSEEPPPDSEYDPALDLGLITSSSVRLLDEHNNMVGVVSKAEAIRKAQDDDLMLAILSIDADPPVLRLFEVADYDKHRYGQQKKKRGQQKKSSASRMDLKEVKMGYNIDAHDYSVRLKAAKKFLKDGDKVKVIVSLKGRENIFRNTAIELIRRFQNDIGELATEENKNFVEKNIFMVLTPNKAAIKKVEDDPNIKELSASEVTASL